MGKATVDPTKFARVTAREKSLMVKLRKEGVAIHTPAARFRRSTETVSRHTDDKGVAKAAAVVGRPRKVTPALAKKLLNTYTAMIAKADAQYEVAMNMVKKKLRLKIAERTLFRFFHSRGIHMRPLYEKPTLTADDKRMRLKWATQHQRRTAKQWRKSPHAIIDNKVFQVYTTGKARAYAARRRVRGAYRARAAKLTTGHTKPAKTLKFNTGAKSVMIACAVGAGRVLMWHEVSGAWNAAAASKMYAGPLRRSLERAYPRFKGTWKVMEDNDSAGYKSNAAQEAKKRNNIEPLSLPRRSPDLNPLDYSVWAQINRKMRAQEAKFSKTKKETRAEFLRRLRRCAMGLSSDYVNETIGDLRSRCQKLVAAKGGHFPDRA